MRLALALILCCLSLNAFAQDATAAMQTVDLNGTKAFYWSPSTERKMPLVIFSHGLGGCADNARFLAEALAQDGFWVVAINHKDARCSGNKLTPVKPEAPMSKPNEWSDQTYASRRDDINNLIEALTKNELFLRHVDFNHIGLMGHSLGGYTVLGMAGGWRSWKSPDIKAVLALAPFTQPFLQKKENINIGIPVMYQCGTDDKGITRAMIKADGMYNQTPPDKYLVVLSGAPHTAWTERGTAFHANILSYGLGFFDYYLKGNASAGKLITDKRTDVSDLFYAIRNGDKTDPPK